MEISKEAARTMKEMVVVVLAEDLIMEILLRLPPVSVLRFKCVSKSWYSLISDPCFLRNHAAQFHLLSQLIRDPPGLLLSPKSDFPAASEMLYSVLYAILPQDEDEKPNMMLKVFLDHSLPAFEEIFPNCYLIDSCNGLLLYHTESGSPNHYTVFNPITNQYKEVPLMDLLQTFIKPPNKLGKTTKVFNHPHIVFDPSISLSYKLLAVMRGPPYTQFQLYVYSEVGSWRLLTSFTDEYIPSRNTFMFHGVFYWLCHHDSICFDVVKESVWLLPLPPIPAGYLGRDVLYFGECGGRLRLIEEYYGYNGNAARNCPCSFDIMEMEQGSRIWTVKSRVILEAGPLNRADDVKVMHLYKTEKKGEEAVLLNVGYKWVVSFNNTTNTFGKKLRIPYFERLHCLNAFPFTPTLYHLNASNFVKMGTKISF